MGWGALLSGTNAIRSLALSGGVALHAINLYIVTTILPSVVRDIGGLDYYAWNTTLFVVASIIGATLSAALMRRAGPRGSYAIAASIFCIGGLLCASAPAMAMLLLGRSVQGLGGGMLVALPYAMIRMIFPEGLWPRAMALISSMWGAATLIGPAVGGIFAEMDAWRAAFWSLIPATILFTILAVAVLPRKRSDSSTTATLAWPQLLLVAVAALAVSAGSVSETVMWNVVGLVIAVILSVLLIRVESRARVRLLPRGALRASSTLGMLYITMALLSITVTSSEIFLPLFLQVLHDQSPLMAGYLAAVMSAGWTIGAVLSSGATPQRVKRTLRLAPLLSTAGMLVLALLIPYPGHGDWRLLAPICIALIAVGAGVGVCWPHLLTRVLQFAPADEPDLASSSITTVQLFATALGAALAGMVANLAGLSVPGGETGVANAALWLFALFALPPALALFSAARVTRARLPRGAESASSA